MEIFVSPELKKIIAEISETSMSLDHWLEHAAPDWFQTENFCGGFEVAEGEFTFSYYAPDGKEYWFQFPLVAVPRILSGEITAFEGRLAFT